MKVLFVSNSYLSKNNFKTNIFCLDQAKSLKKLGVDVLMLTFDFRSIRRIRKFGLSKHLIENIEIYNYSLPLNPMPYKCFDYIASKIFYHVFKYIEKDKDKIDIIHSHFLENSIYVIKNKSKIKSKIIVTEHSSTLLTNINNKKVLDRGNIVYKEADKIICVGSKLQKQIKSVFNQESHCIYNVLDLDSFSICHNDSKEYVFISIGHYITRKNHAMLIKAFKNIAKKDMKLYIIGRGKEYKHLKNLIEKLNLKNQIFLTGYLDRKEINKLFSKAKCFVLASNFETFGVAYIEAMACGLPVIATRCGGPEDFVNKDNGLLVETGNQKMLEDAMIYMYENYQKYDKKEIRNFALNNFSPEIIGRKIQKIYIDLLNESAN